ncbi:MAG TPA: hypothetical protein VE944_13150, partial [Nostoc sp.]|uniref:hypothetical protein n=1 Tax=Nostoc sp. TaxID=1180 RepID=UPI002D67F778
SQRNGCPGLIEQRWPPSTANQQSDAPPFISVRIFWVKVELFRRKLTVSGGWQRQCHSVNFYKFP